MPIRHCSSLTAAVRRSTLRFALVLVAVIVPAGSLRAQMEHVVFITSDTHGIAPGFVNAPNGANFGGQPAADFLCTQNAFAAGFIPNWNGIDKVWRALISTTTVYANARMAIVGRVVNTHGDVLANDQSDFWDGTIATGVNYNEFGGLLPDNTTFWTGSNSVGDVASQNAQNWTSAASSQLATTGRSQTTVNWFNQAQFPADQFLRLLAISPPRVINPGDFNDDGQVDTVDYVVWRKTMGNTVARGVAADGDGDGTIGLGDLTVWRAKFGTSYSAGSGSSIESASVPEPSTLLLLGIGAISLLGFRKAKS